MNAIESYEMEFGRLPSPASYGDELRQAGMWDGKAKGVPLDDWGRPIILRVPGQHGTFDLYSCGTDGIDQQGGFDDVSSWAGVNDGFHWKRRWPEGRTTIKAGIGVGLVLLLTSLIFRWWSLLPLAIAVGAFGVFVGSQLLMHPGQAPRHNDPLARTAGVALCILIPAGVVFVLLVRKGSALRRTATGSVL